MTAEGRTTNSIVFMDTETGGVLPQHPTIQLAAIAVDESTGEELSAFEVKIQFNESDADPEALKMNHYDAEVWKKEAVTPTVAANRFADWVRPYCSVQMVSKRTGKPYSVAKVAGYNVSFDWPRLQGLFVNAGLFLPCSYLARCVMQKALWYFDDRPELPRPKDHKLGTVCAYFGIEAGEGAHDALVDCRATAALARKLRKE